MKGAKKLNILVNFAVVNIPVFQICALILVQKVQLKSINQHCKNLLVKVAKPPLLFLNSFKWKKKHYRIF
jgi:hypothetical protein